MRRFATGLDTPNPAFNEQQRADCAPRSTLGDGSINSGDVVQTRRYATGLDPLTEAGGPTAPSIIPESLSALVEAFSGYTAGREIRIGKAEYVETTMSIPVEMTTVGDEAAVSFTLEYDASLISNPRVSPGDSISEDAILTVNLNERGRIGVLVDSATSLVMSKGTTRLIVVTFDVVSEASDIGEVSFGDATAARSVSNSFGNSLAVRWIGNK